MVPEGRGRAGAWGLTIEIIIRPLCNRPPKWGLKTGIAWRQAVAAMGSTVRPTASAYFR